MKHFTQTTANGLHTPPCGGSQSKSTRFSLFTSLLLFFLLIVGSNAAWADNITFQGNEVFYFDKLSNSGWDGSIVANDANIYLQFANNGNNQTRSSAAQWEDQGEGILRATVPSGTYNQVRIIRVNKGNDSQVWNEFAWLTLQTGKNQILNGGSWSTYVVVPCDNPKPAADMYMAGQGFPGISWTINSITMSWDCDNGVYYKTFTNLTANNNMTYRFKLNPSTDTSWGSQLNSDAIDNSHEGANLALKSDNEDKRITFDLAQNSDVTIYTNGTKVWAAIPAPEPAALNCRLRGDIWLDEYNNWIGKAAGPQFIDNGDGTATISYLVNTQAPRITFVKDGSEKSDNKWDETNSTSGFLNTPGDKYKFNKIASGVKKVTLTYTEATDKLVGVYGAYDVDYTGWKLYVDGGSALDMDNSGQRVVSLASGDHYFYITDGSATTFYGINKFGGMYLSTSYTNQGVTITFPSQRYYDTGSTYKFNINGENIPTYPIKGQYDLSAQFSINKAANVTFSFDGGVISLAAVEPAAPHTVTIHPNNGESTFTMNVADGGTISSISASYGQGTATWYTNEGCTAGNEFTLNSTAVTDDIDLYAKWGVSGNYYFVSCLQTASDAGSSGNWSNGLSRQMTYESGSSGKCSFSFIAPSGHMPFEIIKNQSWSEKINGGTYSGMFDNASSDVTISATGGHMDFNLDAPKKVTVSYDGKVTVKVEDYTFDNSQTYHIKTSWGNGGAAGNYNTTMTNNGTTNATAILRNVPAGNNSFIISTKTGDDDAYAKVGTRTFHALYVDMSSPSSGLSWNTTSARRDGSDNFNSTSPQADGHYYRNCSFNLSAVSDIRITFDGGKIRCDILPKYTVSFNSNGGSEVASQSVFEGATASEPSAPTKAGCNFQGWQLSGADYTFSEAVTGNITLDAVWAYMAISSVELNESEHTTWVGNSDFVLTLTKNPSDLITKTIVWSSDAEGVASVSDGTVHAEGVGTATITCTVTDMFDHVESASCEVSVAACEMTTDNLYSMTVTGYNSSTGSSATLNGLWNESSDNDGPATITKCKVRVGDFGGSQKYAVDNNGLLEAQNTGDDWLLIPAGKNGSDQQLYYIKNNSTNRYITFGERKNTGNWELYQTITTLSIDNNHITDYQFYEGQCGESRIVSMHGNCSGNYDINAGTDFFIHRHNWNLPEWNLASPYVAVGKSDGCQSGNAYLRSAFTNKSSVPNPNYKASQMNSAYYRMKADATVRANLANGLAYGSVITVRLYADAATTVQLTKADGTEIETIDLSADAAREYTYTVAYGSELVGATAFIIKAADNHAGIASIEVSRMHAVSPADPALTWDADLSSGVTQSALAGTFQHVASSALSSGAIHYTSSNEAVATVAADGTVTPIMAGSTTITATIEQRECYAEASIPYEVTLTEPTLAEMIAADAGEGITLTHDYAENIVIDKAITINGAGHSVGNLTVETAGDLTLSGALTVNDFSIYAKAGNTTTPAASGQVRNAANLTANGNAYFYYTVDPSGTVHYGWYDFTVPFRVNVMTGIAGIENEVLNEDFVNERNYAIMEHLGDKQAAGEYSYKKFRGIMEPCRLYSITLDDDFNYNTIRFKKADGALAAGNDVTLNAYDGIDTKHANWNGVGNGTLHHADVEVSTVGYIQVYQSGDKTFLPVNNDEYSLVVGSAFMVQQAGTMTLNQASHDKLLAPRRAASAQATAIQIASEGKPFSDQLYITADELAGQGYTQGVDVAKAGNIGNVNVPQIWTNAYNTSLCAHEAQLIDGEAQYTLSLYAPANGTYTLTSKNIPEGYTLYLTQNGNKLWDMSDTYVLDLTKGTTTEYGLLLVENYKMPTAVDNIYSNTDETTKIMRNGILYILQNGKVFNAQGARVK